MAEVDGQEVILTSMDKATDTSAELEEGATVAAQTSFDVKEKEAAEARRVRRRRQPQSLRGGEDNEDNEVLQELDLTFRDMSLGILPEVVEHISALQKLVLVRCNLCAEGLNGLCKALLENCTLQELDLYCNEIRDDGAKVVSQALLKNTTLQRLNLMDNEIRALGANELAEALRKNTALQVLILSENKVGKDGATALAKALQKNDSLQRLDMDGTRINDGGAVALAEALQVNEALRALNLRNNQIQAEGAKALAEALRGNSSLRELNLCWNKIGDSGATALVEVLGENKTIQILNLVDNEFGVEVARELAKVLRVNDTLQRLSLGDNQIGDEGASVLAEALSVNYTIQRLDISWCAIGLNGTTAFAEALQKNHTLEELRLSGNQIRADGATVLAKALQMSNSLQTLNLGENHIGDDGAKALAQALVVNKALRELALYKNSIGTTDKPSDGALAIAEALQENKTLQRLYLQGNKIRDIDAREFAQALQMNSTLLQLDLKGCGYDWITVDVAKVLAEALRKNVALQELNLENNQVGNDSARALAEALKVNKTLVSLYLGVNEIGADGAEAFAEALRQNNGLQKLCLDSNRIGPHGAKALVKALEVNRTLQELDLGQNEIGSGEFEIGSSGAGDVHPVWAFAQALEVLWTSTENHTLQRFSLQGNQIGPIGAKALRNALEARSLINNTIQVHNNIQVLNLSNNLFPALAKGAAPAPELDGTFPLLSEFWCCCRATVRAALPQSTPTAVDEGEEASIAGSAHVESQDVPIGPPSQVTMDNTKGHSERKVAKVEVVALAQRESKQVDAGLHRCSEFGPIFSVQNLDHLLCEFAVFEEKDTGRALKDMLNGREKPLLALLEEGMALDITKVPEDRRDHWKEAVRFAQQFELRECIAEKCPFRKLPTQREEDESCVKAEEAGDLTAEEKMNAALKQRVVVHRRGEEATLTFASLVHLDGMLNDIILVVLGWQNKESMKKAKKPRLVLMRTDIEDVVQEVCFEERSAGRHAGVAHEEDFVDTFSLLTDCTKVLKAQLPQVTTGVSETHEQATTRRALEVAERYELQRVSQNFKDPTQKVRAKLQVLVRRRDGYLMKGQGADHVAEVHCAEPATHSGVWVSYQMGAYHVAEAKWAYTVLLRERVDHGEPELFVQSSIEVDSKPDNVDTPASSSTSKPSDLGVSPMCPYKSGSGSLSATTGTSGLERQSNEATSSSPSVNLRDGGSEHEASPGLEHADDPAAMNLDSMVNPLEQKPGQVQRDVNQYCVEIRNTFINVCEQDEREGNSMTRSHSWWSI